MACWLGPCKATPETWGKCGSLLAFEFRLFLLQVLLKSFLAGQKAFKAAGMSICLSLTGEFLLVIMRLEKTYS